MSSNNRVPFAGFEMDADDAMSRREKARHSKDGCSLHLRCNGPSAPSSCCHRQNLVTAIWLASYACIQIVPAKGSLVLLHTGTDPITLSSCYFSSGCSSLPQDILVLLQMHACLACILHTCICLSYQGSFILLHAGTGLLAPSKCCP